MISCVAIVVPYKVNDDSSITYWMQTRQSDEYGGLREFPGGKLDPNESIQDCAVREVREEVGVEIAVDMLRHYSTKTVNLPNKILSIGIFLTDKIELFPKEGLVTISECLNLKESLATLPANYEMINEVHSFLLRESGLTSLTAK